ncbi:hypothetical protein AB0L06_38530 [Spirillospora sp. NPDC052269]
MKRWFGKRDDAQPRTSDSAGDMMPLQFDASAWQQVRADAWTDSDGDAALLNYFPLVPDLPAALEDLQQLREATSANTAAQGGGLVELDVITLDGVPAVRQIVKLRDPDRQTGLVFIGSFIVPRANCSVVLRVQAFEGPVTGMREAVLLDGFLAQNGGANSGDPMTGWAQHAYAPGVRGGLPRNHADDRRWDEQFPDHPLSRARRTLDRLGASIHLDQRFKEQPAFAGPAGP